MKPTDFVKRQRMSNINTQQILLLCTHDILSFPFSYTHSLFLCVYLMKIFTYYSFAPHCIMVEVIQRRKYDIQQNTYTHTLHLTKLTHPIILSRRVGISDDGSVIHWMVWVECVVHRYTGFGVLENIYIKFYSIYLRKVSSINQKARVITTHNVTDYFRLNQAKMTMSYGTRVDLMQRKCVRQSLCFMSCGGDVKLTLCYI